MTFQYDLILGWTSTCYVLLFVGFFIMYLFNDYNPSNATTNHIGKWLFLDSMVFLTVGSFMFFYSNSVRDALLAPRLEPLRQSLDDINLNTSSIQTWDEPKTLFLSFVY